jgi:hypothetical protein
MFFNKKCQECRLFQGDRLFFSVHLRKEINALTNERGKALAFFWGFSSEHQKRYNLTQHTRVDSYPECGDDVISPTFPCR